MKKSLAVFASFVLLSFPAFAQQTPVAGITFKLGDDVRTVKSALETSLDPEPMESPASTTFINLNAGKKVLFLRTRGIRVFFNKAGLVETIRFEPPFAGSIKGVKLGDTEEQVRSAASVFICTRRHCLRSLRRQR
jgi:hypothetical protein